MQYQRKAGMPLGVHPNCIAGNIGSRLPRISKEFKAMYEEVDALVKDLADFIDVIDNAVC